jgi:hypothetical protein
MWHVYKEVDCIWKDLGTMVGEEVEKKVTELRQLMNNLS